MSTDIVMPGGMDGAELGPDARRRMPGLKVIYASGYTRNGMGGGIDLDADIDLVNKPYSKEDLGRIVHTVLNR